MTKREMFNHIAETMVNDAEVVEFCNHEIELLDKRSSKERGLTANQKANLEILEVIKNDLVMMEAGITISELKENFENLNDYSIQKLSALMSKLVKEGTVKRESAGKKTLFSLA